MKDNIISQNQEYIARKLGFDRYSDCLRYPKFIEIETIRACNARCSFCAIDNWDTDLKKTIISDELFGKFLEDIKRNCSFIDTICVCRDGEPLLDRRISERIRLIKSAGVRNVTLSTNASLLSHARAMELIDSGLDEIMFSIDGFTKQTFEKIKKNLRFETVVENVLNFLELRNKMNSSLLARIRMVATEDNRHEVPEWKRFWMSKAGPADSVQAREPHTWANQISDISLKHNEVDNNLPCIAPFNMFVIHYNGNVVMCCHDFKEKHVVGSIWNSSINEIWNNADFEYIRSQHLHGGRNNLPMCLGCNIWERKIIG